jgi:hypothetical protein
MMKRLEELSKRIHDIIISKPFNAESYSEISNDLILTFINARLDSLLSNFNIDSKAIYNTILTTFIDNINKTLNFEKSIVFELISLIPELALIQEWHDFYRQVDIPVILKKIEEKYCIVIKESQLVEYWKTRNNIQLPNEIQTKLLNLCSHYLKINKFKDIKDLLSIISERSLPFAVDVSSLYKREEHQDHINNMSWETLIYFHELKTISNLMSSFRNITLPRFINSIFKFKSKYDETSNLLQYVLDNDIWKLARVTTNFKYIDKSTKKTSIISKNKLELLEMIKKHPHRYNEHNLQPIDGNFELLSSDKYLDINFYYHDLNTKVSNFYFTWVHDPEVVKWDNYWAYCEEEYFQKEHKMDQEKLNSEISNVIVETMKKFDVRIEKQTNGKLKQVNPRYSSKFTPSFLMKCLEIRNRYPDLSSTSLLRKIAIELEIEYETIRKWFRCNGKFYSKFIDKSEFEIVSSLEPNDIKSWFKALIKKDKRFQKMFKKHYPTNT